MIIDEVIVDLDKCHQYSPGDQWLSQRGNHYIIYHYIPDCRGRGRRRRVSYGVIAIAITYPCWGERGGGGGGGGVVKLGVHPFVASLCQPANNTLKVPHKLTDAMSPLIVGSLLVKKIWACYCNWYKSAQLSGSWHYTWFNTMKPWARPVGVGGGGGATTPVN